MTLTCTGGVGTITVTVTTTKNDHSVAWGTGKVSPSLHGIPVSFTGTFIDLNTSTTIFPIFFGGLGSALGITPVFLGMSALLAAGGILSRRR